MPGGKTKNTRRLGTLNTSKKNINILKNAASRKNEIHDTRNNEKEQVKLKKPQQQKMKARLQKPKHKGPKEKEWRAAAQK